MTPVIVEVLVTENCPHEDAALRLVATTSQAVGVRPRVMLVEVATLDQVQKHAFVGSPTIRVNGIDVAPPAQDQPLSLSCRQYPTARGLSGLPGHEYVRAALAKARAEGEQ